MTDPSLPDFEAKGYWETRLDDDWSLESVGDRSLSRSFNEWMYRVRRDRFLQQVADIGLAVNSSTVLDIGSGTGFYVDLWQELGARTVTGSDLTEAAVANLQVARPEVPFLQLDIGGALPAELERSFDIVSAYDMFFHIVDDARFATALTNIAKMLRPGGTLLFSDSLLTGDRPLDQPPHVKLRHLETVRQMLLERGFAIVDQRPVFVLLNAPIDSSSRTRQLGWKLVAWPSRRSERAGDWIGRLLFPIEMGLLKRSQLGPGVRMFACQLAGA